MQDADDEFDCSELSSTYDTQPTEPTTVEEPTPPMPQPFMPDGDMEDVIAEGASQNNKIMSEIVINGLKMTKAKAL
jgi:hypothetical protein